MEEISKVLHVCMHFCVVCVACIVHDFHCVLTSSVCLYCSVIGSSSAVGGASNILNKREANTHIQNHFDTPVLAIHGM